jgi:hypothetical protein
MDSIFELILFAIFVLFAVFAAIKRNIEARDIEKRNMESDWTAEDLPEETRRMLFGEKTPPTATPAQPRQTPNPFGEVRDVLIELQRQFDAKTARPREGTSRPEPPAVPPAVPQAPRPAHPQQPQFRPEQVQPPRVPAPQRPAAPPRQPPRPQPPRMVPQQSQGAMPRQEQPYERRFAPPTRQGQPRTAARRMREPDEGPTVPMQRASQKQPRARVSRRRSQWLSSPEDLRRGIILSEILGPPKCMQFDSE